MGEAVESFGQVSEKSTKTFAAFVFLHLGNSDHVVVCVFIDFPISSKNNILFIAQFLVLLS